MAGRAQDAGVGPEKIRGRQQTLPAFVKSHLEKFYHLNICISALNLVRTVDMPEKGVSGISLFPAFG